jgi:2-amino-4-hydroxy-6-hydroxymethyldihydropteridine diphosphokinase
MACVYLGLGSNVQREQNIRSALRVLRQRFNVIGVSSVYDSAAMGFDGDPFLNLVICIDTGLAPGDLQKALQLIEREHGATGLEEKNSARAVDIDILLYDDVVACVDNIMLPRAEILHNAFVLCPLAEIAPDKIHPVVGTSYRRLWQEFDQASQQLTRMDAF